MDHRADRRERRIRLEPEARQEHLERDAAAHVGEARAVEIEAHRPLRAIARRVDPLEAGLAIDETLDEPGAREAIDPEILARGPGAPAEFGRVGATHLAAARARLARGSEAEHFAL